jgi:polysaccharide export outer membrane protein
MDGEKAMRARRLKLWAGIAVIACLLGSFGCFHTQGISSPDGLSPRVNGPITMPPPNAVPTELTKITFPPYVVEAPDNLMIQVVQRARVPDKEFKPPANDPMAKAPLVDSTKPLPVQDISGSFLVRMDGVVNLGFWGTVHVAGLTLDQTAEAVRQHLLNQKTLKDLGTVPESLVVIVDVVAYNSKRYYIVMDGGGYGEQVYTLPITGSDTVLDALANVFGLHTSASKRNIWVARRSPHADQPWQILPVDWVGITQHGITTTNYQVLPGDRIYVKAQRIITFDTTLSRWLSPLERILGVTLLGANVNNQIKGNVGGTTP